LQGENNPNWQGGKTSLQAKIRTCVEYRFWRDAIFRRDKYTCKKCGASTKVGRRVYLNADHIVPLAVLMNQHKITTIDEARDCVALWDIANGETLCHPYHRKTPTYGRNLKHV
jgi:5-methylcytosine-specific restriction endonuclease McrA